MGIILLIMVLKVTDFMLLLRAFEAYPLYLVTALYAVVMGFCSYSATDGYLHRLLRWWGSK